MEIIKILEREPIRLLDGRYSDGFVDIDELKRLIQEKRVTTYENKGITFVAKLSKNKPGAQAE